MALRATVRERDGLDFLAIWTLVDDG